MKPVWANKEIEKRLSLDRLKEVLDYNASKGVFTWRVLCGSAARGRNAGHLDHRGYVVIRLDYCLYGAHRLAWFYSFGRWPKDQIDHLNGDSSDNRLSNLREAAQSLNMQNCVRVRADNKSGVQGVHIRGAYIHSSLKVNGKAVHLGTFETIQEAHQAYLAAKRKLHPGCTI